MTRPVLWTDEQISAATQAHCTAPFTVSGVSIDTRSLEPGDLFVALPGSGRDGHDFVDAAFVAGATAALVCRGKIDPMKAAGPLVEVDDVPAALEALAHAARARSGAYITAVTGSVGKTSVKEALRLALSKSGETFASEKSFNNHIGVPLSLARMPQDCAYGVFEVGMNHAGEIDALVRMVRPHCAIVTHVGTAHIEHFDSEADIARAKGEIFNDMASDVVGGGTVIIPADNPHVDLLVELAEARGIAD
ncbi:MAG: Mur ligase family protein, partial [Pseudomonadota bacterium]|nr:Mur ligase family protein [Pseudomonadota bacterium]